MNKHIYIIMPIKVDLSYKMKRSYLEEVAKFYSLTMYFPFDEKLRCTSMIRKRVLRSSFAIVDLSYERHSCYYELGFLQGLNIETHLIAEKDTPIYQAYGNVDFYLGMEEYKKVIKKIFNTINKIVNYQREIK